MTFQSKILSLTKLLYPTGRAFRMHEGGELEKLHKGLARSESRAYEDALAIHNSMVPTNANFTEDDATDWERRLGIYSGSTVSLADRKAAIDRKWNHPGEIVPRQNYRFLERELRLAGFDVYVFENRFDYGGGVYYTRGPLDVSGGLGGTAIQHGQIQHGQRRHGMVFSQIVVNSVSNEKDLTFNIGSNLRSTFFVGGTPLGTFANVDADREQEFRQLILRIKPVQTVAYLLVNYI